MEKPSYDAFWDLLWMLTEEQTRKLDNDDRDSVMRILTERDASGVGFIGRAGDLLHVRIGEVVFHLPLAEGSGALEPTDPLPSDLPQPPDMETWGKKGS